MEKDNFEENQAETNIRKNHIVVTKASINIPIPFH